MPRPDISYRLTENFQYLKDFLYTEPEKYFESNESKIFGDCRWVFLSDVLEAGSVNPDDIFHWILNQDVFVDLEKDLLRQPRYCRIFRTQTDSLLLEDVKSVSRHTEPRLGGRVNFCGNVYRISSIKPQFYLLEDEACGIKSVPKKLLDDQLASGTAFLYVEDQGAVFNLLQKAGPRELEQANHRLKILDEIKGGKPIGEVAKSHSISERTIRNWLRQFNLSEHELGEGFVGLIPKISSRGNRESRLDPATRSLIELTLEEHYLNKKSPPLSHAYGLFLHACEKSGIPTVSFKTFSSFAKSIDTAKKVRARSGDKAAYQHESGSNKGRKMPWDLSGQFAMDVVHTDHTQLDIELVSSKNGTGLGRPWLTLFLDGFSRKPVGFAILYDPPSYRSLMIGIRQMVKATGYFPASFVVDGGKEFQGIYFETLVASKGSSIQKRQGNPRQGALIERYFGSVTSQLIDRLQGNTQPTKNVRQMSRDMNPKRNAIWTLESLHAALDSFFELYSTSDHPAL
ncbi:MAG TPA: transposase, partial [Phycisphaerales bacterium]|nr:transposase [Phycisphaerales bacterium]